MVEGVLELVERAGVASGREARGTKICKPLSSALLGKNNEEMLGDGLSKGGESFSSPINQFIFRLLQKMVILAKDSSDISFSTSTLPATFSATSPAALAATPLSSISNEPIEARATSAFCSNLCASIAPRLAGDFARNSLSSRSIFGSCQASVRLAIKASVRHSEATLRKNNHNSDEK